MSEMWRCPNGHSGLLDQAESGGLPSACPTCGASTMQMLSSSRGDPDQTLLPEFASSDGPNPASGTQHLDDDAPAGPVDPTDFTLSAAGEGAAAPHQTANLRGPARRPDSPAAQPPSSEERTLNIHTGFLLQGPSLGTPNKAAASRDPTVACDDAPKSAACDTMAPDEGERLSEPPIIGKSRALPRVPGYELLAELGRGGMGVVYKARQVSLNRLIALKMILGADRASAKDLARFQIEAEAVAQLTHPNIVQIYEIGEHEGCPYFSLEFVAGGTLAERTGVRGEPPARAARIVRELAAAMDFAHRRGIIHRDLKPANVLLALPDDVMPPNVGDPFPLDLCIPKITDFGLAKRLEGDGARTHDGAILGTPNYMPPEQARGQIKHVGPAADIYALGSILYDLLTGRPPFKGSTVMETLQWVVHREPVPPRTVNALVPSDLSTICLKCLEKDPARRYATAGDLAEDLRRYLDGEPILARPSSWLERSVKWSRRRPTAAALVGAGILAVLAMSAGGVAFALHERHVAAKENKLRQVADDQRDQAEKNRQAAQANFLEACQAVDDMLLQVGSQRLADEPRMEKVRRELLDKAARFYAKHLEDAGPDSLLAAGNDPHVRWRAARSSYQLGRIEQILDQTAAAEQHFRRAVQLLDELTKELPAERQYRQDLANAHNNLGVLYNAQRKLDKAESEHRQAQALRRELADEDGTNVDYQLAAATSTFNLGQVERQRGHLSQAKESLTAALKQVQALPGAAPASRQLTAQIYNALGQTLQDMGQAGDAKAAFEQARDLLRGLARSDRENAMPEYRKELADTFSNLGQLQRDRDPSAAELAYKEALTLTQGLVDDFPSTPIYRRELAATLNNRAVYLQAKGDGNEAEKLYVRAIHEERRLADELPLQPDYRRDLVAALNSRGQQLISDGRLTEAQQIYDEAIAIMRALLKDYPDTPVYVQELGHCLSNDAHLQLALNKPDAANECMDEALRVHKQLADRFRADRPEYRYEYGRAQVNYGGLLELQHQLPEAKREYFAALDTLRPLVREHPDEPDYQRQLAVTCGNLADLLSQMTQVADARPLWAEAHHLLGELAERYRGVPDYRKDLAHSYTVYGLRFVQDRKFDEAAAAWEQERALQQELVDQFPQSAAYRIDLATTLANLANLAAERNRIDQAGKLYRQAVEVLEEYKGRDAAGPAFRSLLLNNVKYRANFLRGTAVDIQQALDAQTDLIRLRQQAVDAASDNLEQRRFLAVEQYQLAFLYFDANDNRAARTALEKAFEIQSVIVEKLPGDGTPRVEAAASLAWCIVAVDRETNLSGVARVVLRLMYAERAMQYLQEAARRGFKDSAAIKQTEAFAPLRDRADFQELLRKMETGMR